MINFPRKWLLGVGLEAVIRVLIAVWIARGVWLCPIPTAKPRGQPVTIGTPPSRDAQEPPQYRQRRQRMVRIGASITIGN